MRVAVSLSLCTAIALAIGVSDASAQMNADEIFNRLKAQAGEAGTQQAAPGAQTRGLRASYGEPRTAPAASPTAPAAPSRVEASPAPTSVAVAPAYTEVEPAATELTPSFTSSTEPAGASFTLPSESAPSVAAATPAYQPATAPSPVPTYVIESPTYVETAPAATPVAVSASAATYTAVEEDKRVDLRIYFEWNSASLKPEAIGQLAELCTAIRRVGATENNQFKIIGHTDKSGSNEYNLYLSNARAREVKRHLVESCALPAEALLAVGEGENQSSPTTPANAPEERRVEIQFVS